LPRKGKGGLRSTKLMAVNQIQKINRRYEKRRRKKGKPPCITRVRGQEKEKENNGELKWKES